MTRLPISDENLTMGARSGSKTDLKLEALKERLGEGDAAAFETVFRRLSESVFRYVCGMVQDDVRARDITQETFATLWEVRDRMASINALRPYIFRMARNEVYNRQREARVRRENQDELQDVHSTFSPPAPDDRLENDMLRSMIEQWIEDLPNRQREALCLRREQNLSHDEIADVMDVSPNTVNNHLVRAMKTLRGRLREHRPELLS